MARFEADHGDPGRALRLARDAHRARPTIHASDALGWALYRSGNPEGALPHAKAALRLGTIDPVIHYHAAAIFAANDQTKLATDEVMVALAHRFTLSPAQVDEATDLANELGVPGQKGKEYAG